MEIVNSVLNWLAINWEWFAGLGALTLLAGVESFVMTFVTKRFGPQRTQLFKMYATAAFMTVTSGIIYLATTPVVPPILIPFVGAAKFVLAQPWYLKIWEPLYKKAVEYISKANAFDEQTRVELEPQPADFTN